MRKYYILGLLLAIIWACAEDPKKKFLSPEEIQNPNGDSELAIVMRHLHYEAALVKDAMQDNVEPDIDTLIILSNLVSTAAATDASVKDSAYMHVASQLAEQAAKIEGFGRFYEFQKMIDLCLSCHAFTCPGPINKIRQLNTHRP